MRNRHALGAGQREQAAAVFHPWRAGFKRQRPSLGHILDLKVEKADQRLVGTICGLHELNDGHGMSGDHADFWPSSGEVTGRAADASKTPATCHSPSGRMIT